MNKAILYIIISCIENMNEIEWNRIALILDAEDKLVSFSNIDGDEETDSNFSSLFIRWICHYTWNINWI